jgi:hypothetical protein
MREPSFQKRVNILEEDRRNEWLKYRIELFNTITFPSLAQHDAHVVLFMSHGDEWVFESLHRNDQFHVLYQDGDIKNISTRFLKDTFHKESLYILRLDSDDAIHKDFFDFEAQMNSYVMQPWGIKWDGTRTSTFYYPNNPYVTTYTNTCMTPFFGPHTSIMTKNPVVIERDPMWLMNIHGGNIINHFNRKDIDFTPVDLAPFGLGGTE